MAVEDLFFVNENGLFYASFPEVLNFYREGYRLIFGEDVNLDDDSQDGQWMATQALALYNTMQESAKVYQSFSPLTAVSDALTRNVKINGISRRSATYSTADVDIIGQAGTEIINGRVNDTLGQSWILPSSVTIPLSGTITITVTAQEIGAIMAFANTITEIATPTRGWQSVNNPLASIPGVAVESDAELRDRQAISTALPSVSIFDGIIGAVASLDGVTRLRGYENDTNITDSNGLPPHSFSLVVEGGDTQEIGDTISPRSIGALSYGTTSVDTYDLYGNLKVVSFYRPTVVTIGVEITIEALIGYSSSFEDLIKQSVSDYINELTIGVDVLITKLFVPANLPGTEAGNTYDITQLRIQKDGGGYITTNIDILFNEVTVCDKDVDITVIVI